MGVAGDWRNLWNPWWSARFSLVSPLEAAECRSRLRQATTTQMFNRRAIGRTPFTLSDFALYRKRWFRPALIYIYVRLRPAIASGTTVLVRATAPIYVRVTYAIWSAFIGFLVVVAAVSAVRNRDFAFASIWLIAMLAFFLGGIAIQRLARRQDVEDVMVFLRNELELSQGSGLGQVVDRDAGEG